MLASLKKLADSLNFIAISSRSCEKGSSLSRKMESPFGKLLIITAFFIFTSTSEQFTATTHVENLKFSTAVNACLRL